MRFGGESKNRYTKMSSVEISVINNKHRCFSYFLHFTKNKTCFMIKIKRNIITN